MDRKRLGNALTRAQKLTKDQLQSAFSMHDKIGGDFGSLLVKLGYISAENLTDIVAKLEGINTVDVATLIIPEKLVMSFPRDIIEKHNVIPIRKKEGVITLAMSNVSDFQAIDEIQFLTNCKVDPVLASRDSIKKAIIQFYYGAGEKEERERDDKVQEEKKFFEKKDVDSKKLEIALIKLLIEKKVFTEKELLDKYKKIKED